MSSSPPSDPTLAYYDEHAEPYVRDTIGLDMTPLYEPFLALVSPGGHILDAGCGSGRDALAFKRGGYTVTAIDASTEMARLASAVIGEPVEVIRFQDMAFEEVFDGVWACASLLHVPRSEMDSVLFRFARALKHGGVLYASFKVGDGEQVREGRFFNDYEEQGLSDVLARRPELTTLRLWRASDQRPQSWVNLLATRRT